MTRVGRFTKTEWWTFTTHNVMENPLHRSTIPSTVNTALQGSDVVLWQEASDNFTEKVLKKHTHYRHYMPGGVNNDARISYLLPLAMVRGGKKVFQTHRSGVSHERYITWADIKGFPGGATIRCSSRHYWPGAFNYSRSDRLMRKNEWMKGQGTDFDLMADTANETGFPQVAGGDYNRLGNFFPKTFGGYKVHHFSNGLDHIVFVDGKDWVWKFPAPGFRKRVRNTASDHNALMVRARLVRRK